MALKDVRKHIRAIRKTQKIMRAMKMVSTVRLKRAMDRLLAARPYAEQIMEVVADLAAQLDDEQRQEFPLMRRVAVPHRAMLVVITADRGLCGTFNSNVIRMAERFLWEEKASGPPPPWLREQRRRNRRFDEVQVVAVGRKAREHFSSRPDVELVGTHAGLFEKLSYERVRSLADEIEAQYVAGGLHAVFLVYNEFKNILVRNVVVEQFLPVVPRGGVVMTESVAPRGGQRAYGQPEAPRGVSSMRYEPDLPTVLSHLLPKYFATRLFHALLESSAAEHAARMTAMDAAAKNSGKLLDQLTQQYNRARQALITKELLEIIGGAEALK